MKKRILLILPTVLVLSACSMGAPNDVTLTTTPGVCVNSVVPKYEVNASVYYPYNSYPMNSYMPANSPYCMAVTITNNNSGKNSNNIQVYQQGLMLSYTVESTIYSASMVDFNAAGLSKQSFGYYVYQQLGNIALFDPNNCVTTFGAKVNTLNKNGGACTFYLQSVSESMPVGRYPLSVSVNYTNGNDNYTVESNIYNNITLYAGGEFSQPSQSIAKYTAGQSDTAESLGVADIFNKPIQLLARDGVGNIYGYDGTTVYMYNGLAITATNGTQPVGITSLNADSFGNLFAATNNGLQVYSAYQGSSAAWSQVSGTSGLNVAAVQSESAMGNNVLYLTVNNVGVESCIYANNSCSPTVSFAANEIFNNNALILNPLESQVVWATNAGIYMNSLTPLAVENNYVLNESGMLGIDPLGFIYVANHVGIESAIYANIGNATTLAPLQDSVGNSLHGNANGVRLRSYTLNNAAGTASVSSMTLYSYGSELSALTPFVEQYLVYLDMAVGTSLGNNYYATGTWTPIGGFNGKVNATVIASSLTNN